MGDLEQLLGHTDWSTISSAIGVGVVLGAAAAIGVYSAAKNYFTHTKKPLYGEKESHQKPYVSKDTRELK